MRTIILGVLAAFTIAYPAAAQEPALAPPPSPASRVLTADEALAQDAAEYASRHAVPLDLAIKRLRAQETSVAETDRLAALYADRLAGIAIEHDPAYRIVVLLTGDAKPADYTILADGFPVPILFRTGAVATRAQVDAAMRANQAVIRERFPRARGMGLDPRTGELIVIVRASDFDEAKRDDMAADLANLTGVPVRVRGVGKEDRNLAIEGGSRVTGIDPADGKRYACTTGFVVTDTTRTGIVTAAHCPDDLVYSDPAGVQRPLHFVGGWGARTQDVQVNVADEVLPPLFYADTARTEARMPSVARGRLSTRAGDSVCHRGERTGYSCAEVELIDYAPPGDLCGGPCEPVWVTVAGPSCRGGDSGGPVFSGTVAFGLLKGGNYDRDGSCNFYYYMSTDYLPEGWSLLRG